MSDILLTHCACMPCAAQIDEASITGVHKGTVVRGECDFPGGWLRVSDCHEAVIYLLAPLKVCA